MKRSILVLAASIILAGCGDSPEEEKASSVAAQPIDSAKIVEIIQARCSSCHAESPTDDAFKVAPNNVYLENIEQIQKHAARIHARAVATQSMPFMNKTGMTQQERDLIGEWIKAGAPAN